jgi:hypothetical protein
MTARSGLSSVLLVATLGALGAIGAPPVAHAWSPKPTLVDPLVRMPGTQPPQGVIIAPAKTCNGCHGDYEPSLEAMFPWKGSMMGQAARDPLFWAAMTVAAQDSIWAVGTPNAADVCERCHFPKGWLELRSDPPNASLMHGDDFDGVTCEMCHRMVDPFFEQTFAGTREGADFQGYWDETNGSSTPSQSAADATRSDDIGVTAGLTLWGGTPAFTNHVPTLASYTEAGSGQYIVSTSTKRRAAFADAPSNHATSYSRFHKSKYYCGTCHDVSNPVLANLPYANATLGDGTVLPSESLPTYAYFHGERTHSEMVLSDYGQQGGAPGSGAFDPSVFTTSQPGNAIATCQDCHMRDVPGRGCNSANAVFRPGGPEHPKSGVPLHDLVGGNALVPAWLAAVPVTSPAHDPLIAGLLGQGPAVLTVDLDGGVGIDGPALLAGRNRALAELANAATLEDVTYDALTGALALRIVNHTGHKLPTGYPEGRRMFLRVRAWAKGVLVHELNPYDEVLGTLRGLPPSVSAESPPLGPNESYDDALVYEVHLASSLTGEDPTFHFSLATHRSKDNRIPPRGFRIAEASARLAEPVWSGASALDYFSAAEYAGGHDALSLALPSGADTVEVELLYQTTSREYVGFLRSELSASGATLTSPTPSGEANAYIATTDPFFAKLHAWGEVVWSLWEHTKSWPGAAPARMAYAVVVAGNGCAAPVADGTPCQDGDACTVSDTCQSGVCVPGAALACDDANPCTTDGCDPAWGCVHGWTTDPCDDGSACTAKDLCAFGVCAGLLALVCNDGDPCTDNACDPASGCVYEPIVDCTGAGGGGGTGGAGGSGGTGGGGHGGSGGEPNAEGGGGALPGPDGAAPRPGDDAACACGVPGAPGGDGSGQAGLLLLAASLAARRWPRLRDLPFPFPRVSVVPCRSRFRGDPPR